MPTLVLPPRHTPDSQALWRAAIDAGWEVERLTSWRPPEYLVGQDVVLYGEPLFAAVVADSLGIALLEPPFSWLADLPETYRRRQVQFTTLGDARRLPGPAFLKPADDKCFAAKVYPSGAELPGPALVPESTPVLVSEAVVWEVEFRCFVHDRHVRTMSPYLRYGKLAQDENGHWQASTDEWKEAQAIADAVTSDAQVKLPPAIVLDVGKIQDRGWAVVEVNAAWGSGIYGCDTAEVLRIIERACVRKDAVSDEDLPWIIRRSGGR